MRTPASARPVSSRRILHFVRPSSGGMRRHVIDLACAEARRGLTTGLAAPPGFETPEDLEIPLHTIHVAARTRPLADLRSAAALAGLQGRWDLVHAHGLRAGFIGALASRRDGPPLALTVHTMPPARPGRAASLALRFTLRRARLVIAVSGAIVERLMLYGQPREAVALIPNGVDLTPFENPPDRARVRLELGVRPDDLLVLAAGRFSDEKGFDILIDAAALVRESEPRARFVLAGVGPLWEALQDRAAAGGLGSAFLFAGQRSDLADVMAAADLVVIPSRSEGQSLVALEAMASRRCVVASRVGGLAETVLDGRTGTLVRPGDPAALAEAVVGFLRDPALRAEYGERGRLTVERHYRYDTMVDRTIAEVARILR